MVSGHSDKMSLFGSYSVLGEIKIIILRLQKFVVLEVERVYFLPLIYDKRKN